MSASDLIPGTTALETESEIKRKCQKEYDTHLQSVIRDKMYTKMKFVKNKKMVLYVAELRLDTSYVIISID